MRIATACASYLVAPTGCGPAAARSRTKARHHPRPTKRRPEHPMPACASRAVVACHTASDIGLACVLLSGALRSLRTRSAVSFAGDHDGVGVGALRGCTYVLRSRAPAATSSETVRRGNDGWLNASTFGQCSSALAQARANRPPGSPPCVSRKLDTEVSPRGTTAGFRRAQTCAELRGLYERIEAGSQLIRKRVQAPSNTHAARCLSPGRMANTFGRRGSRILLAMSSTLDALGFLATASRLHDARRIAYTFSARS